MKNPVDLPPATLYERRERIFLILAGLFLGTLAMLNILGISRFIKLAQWGEADNAWIFAVAIGVLPYPITFICTDLISEFYGRRRANFVVWVGLLLNLWVVFIMWLGGALPGFETLDPQTGKLLNPDGSEPVFFKVRDLTFGAVTASMIAYLAAQFCDVYLFHFWKRMTKGKKLWLRNNGSTLVSQLVDTVAVILITHFWAQALPPAPPGRSLALHLSLFIVTGYAFKFAVALIDTIPIYVCVHYLGRYLRIDPMREDCDDAEKTSVMRESSGSSTA